MEGKECRLVVGEGGSFAESGVTLTAPVIEPEVGTLDLYEAEDGFRGTFEEVARHEESIRCAGGRGTNIDTIEHPRTPRISSGAHIQVTSKLSPSILRAASSRHQAVMRVVALRDVAEKSNSNWLFNPSGTLDEVSKLLLEAQQELKLNPGVEIKRVDFSWFTLSGTFEGELVDGVPTGKGTWTCSQGGYRNSLMGLKYEGDFEQGRFEGIGTLMRADGSIIFAEKRVSELGLLINECGPGHYFGEVHEGEAQGRGFWISDSGAVYEGSFSHGLFDGSGTLSFISGWEHSGKWKSGKKHGPGVETLAPSPLFGSHVLDKTHGFWNNGIKVTPE